MAWIPYTKQHLPPTEEQKAAVEKKKVLDNGEDRVYNVKKDRDKIIQLSLDLDPGCWELDRVNLRIESLIEYSVKVRAILSGSEHFPDDWIIAGGATRDILIGVQPKDYDVFVNFEDEDQLYRAVDSLCMYLNKNTYVYTEGGPAATGYAQEESSFEGVYYVFDIYPKMQIIMGMWPKTKDPTERFDLSTARSWYDPKTENITYTSHFLNSIVKKEVIAYNDTDYTNKRRTVAERKVFHKDVYAAVSPLKFRPALQI